MEPTSSTSPYSSFSSSTARPPERQHREIFIDRFSRNILSRVEQLATGSFVAKHILPNASPFAALQTALDVSCNTRKYVLPIAERIVARAAANQSERIRKGMEYDDESMVELYTGLAFVQLVSLPGKLYKNYIKSPAKNFAKKHLAPAVNQVLETGIIHLDNALRMPQAGAHGLANMADATSRHYLQRPLDPDSDLDPLVEVSAGKVFVDLATAPIIFSYETLLPGMEKLVREVAGAIYDCGSTYHQGKRLELGREVAGTGHDCANSFEQIEKLELDVEGIQAILKEFKPRSDKKSKPDFGKIGYAMGVQIAHEAAAYMEERSNTRQVSAAVKDFVRRYEEKVKESERPRDSAALRDALINLAGLIQRPEKIADDFANLERAGRELALDITELKDAKTALIAERKKVHKDLKEIDRLDHKYKKALDKALDSAARARKKVGIFSTALNTLGSVLSVIPTPVTMVAGGSLLAATSAVRQGVSGNTDRILDRRIQKNQKRLSENLEHRANFAASLTAISEQLTTIEASQQAYEAWIWSPESVSQLTVEDRFAHLLSITQTSHLRVSELKVSLATKQAEIDGLKKEPSTERSPLAAHRRKHAESQERYHSRPNARRERVITRNEKVIIQLETERNSIAEELKLAELEAKNNEDKLANETTLKPLYQFRQELLKQFERPVAAPNSSEFFIETLILYHQQQQHNLATVMNILGASGELARELNSAGLPLPAHLHYFFQSGVQLVSTLDLLAVTYRQWKSEETALNRDNLINCVIVPFMRGISAAVGIVNAAFAIGHLVGEFVFGKQKQKSLFDHIHEDLSRQMYQLSNWIDSQFVLVGEQLRGQHVDVMNGLKQLRDEYHLLAEEILTRLSTNHKKISSSLKLKAYNDHVLSVKSSVSKIRSSIQMDVDRFLQFIEQELKEVTSGSSNGFITVDRFSLEGGQTWEKTVDLKLAYNKPGYFIGLLAREIGLASNLPNLPRLMAIKKSLGEVKPQTEVQKKNIEEMANTIKGMEDEVLALFEKVKDLVLSLYKEQKELSENGYRQRERSINEKVAYQQAALRDAIDRWKNCSKIEPLGSNRAFLQKIVKTPFKDMMPAFDFASIRMPFTPYFLKGVRPGDYLKRLAESPLEAHLSAQSQELSSDKEELGRPILWVSLMTAEITASISTGNLVSPQATETLGIDLKKRHVVVISSDTSSHVVPFLNCALSIQELRPSFCRHVTETIGLSLAERSFVTIEELREIALINPGMKDKQVASLLKEYDKLLNPQISESPSASDFAKQLGESVFLPSNLPHLVPLAFPKGLFESLESQLALEISFVQNSGLGNFIPHYEFSPDTNVLSIVYCFVTSERTSEPYCKFRIAEFDRTTTISFQKELDHMGMPKAELNDANEFLLQAMYSGMFGLGLPGSKTKVLKNNIVAPVDRSFPGLYRILQHNPSAKLQYCSSTYTEENRAAIFLYLDDDKSVWWKGAVSSMVGSNETPEFYSTAYKIRRDIHEKRKAMLEGSSYERDYYLLMALIKLFSTCEKEDFRGFLQGGLAIYPPAVRDAVLDAQWLVEDPSMNIKGLVDLLESKPSPKKLSLQKPLFRFG